MELPTFLGVLESPLDTGRRWAGDSLPLRGWATHADGLVEAVRVNYPGLPAPLDLAVGLRRADAAAAFPERPSAMNSGFAGDLPLPELTTEALSLEVEVLVAGRVVHTWRRPLPRESVDAAWQRWISAAAVPPAGLRTELPDITWLVCRDDESPASAAETADHWRAMGGPNSRSLVVDGCLALQCPRTPYAGIVRPGDRPVPGLTGLLARALRDEPDLLVADHDHVDAADARVDPVLKPGWHPVLANHPEVATRAWLMHTRHWPSSHAFDDGPALLQAWSATAAPPRRIVQLRSPLLSARAKPCEATVPTTVVSGPPRRTPDERVAVIIPTCLADPAMLARALDGLFATAEASRLEVLVVLNNLRGHTVEEARHRLAHWPVATLHLDGPFNWSAFNNAGARATRARQLLFLNDDVTPIETAWLPAMQAKLALSGVGAVGALLRYPDGRVQHAGIQVHGQPHAMCRHLFRFCRGDEPRVQRWLVHDLPASAVTGACLLTPRSVFESVGGFDEQLPLVYNDVDYCLRLRESGWGSVVAASAQLCHHEGWSRGGLAEESDHARFAGRWQSRLPARDPHSHPWLALDRDDWMPDFNRPARPIIEPRDS